jgi:hypothetical protein
MADDEIDLDDQIITCWCGARGTADELFDDAVYAEGCGGTGHLYCHCGGDLCVCHHHGQEIECPGCPDCRYDGDGDDGDDGDDGYYGRE